MVRSILSEEVWIGNDSNWKQLWKGTAIIYSNFSKHVKIILNDPKLTKAEKIQVIGNKLDGMKEEIKKFEKNIGYPGYILHL